MEINKLHYFEASSERKTLIAGKPQESYHKPPHPIQTKTSLRGLQGGLLIHVEPTNLQPQLGKFRRIPQNTQNVSQKSTGEQGF